MSEYVQRMEFTLQVNTNKQTYKFDGEDWDALDRARAELVENGFAPDAEPLPEVRAEDVAKFRRSVRGIGMEHVTDDRADEFLSGQVALDVSRRILAALEAVQARQTEGR